MSELARQTLLRLREHRTMRERDVSIESVIQRTRDNAESTHRRLGSLIDLWAAHIPAHLVSQTSITGLRRGVLHVNVANSAAIYELDRLLRSGLEQQLRQSYRSTLSRVKLKLAEQASDESSP